MTAIFIVTFALLNVVRIQGSCPDFWTPFQGSCYHLFTDLEQWTQAQVVCTSHKANLAVIETYAENRLLKNMAKNIHGIGAWFGANDLLNEGDFRWVGSNNPLHYTDWATGQPNNFQNGQNCVAFYHDTNWQWDDLPCHDKFPFICEMGTPSVVG